MSEARTIRVTGKGTFKAHPDHIRITLTLKGMEREYDQVLKRSSEETGKLRDVLSGFGFEGKDLKTLNFNVNPEYERYTETERRREVYKTRFIGYEYTHSMKVEFALDNDRLGGMLYALGHSPLAPQISFSYFVGDAEAVKSELLAQAVKDARAKAEVLSNAAGVMLGEVQTIDYSWTNINLEVYPMKAMYSLAEETVGSTYNLDIEPDDVEVSDTVSVVWTIR